MDEDARERAADRRAFPRSLVVFSAAMLAAVGAVVVIAVTGSYWAVAFAVLVMLAVLAAVVGELELEIGGRRLAWPRRSRRRPRAAARPGVPAEWSGPPAAHRLLLVASEPVEDGQLTQLLGGGGTAVLVVAPALHRTGLRYWVSDSDEAIEHARRVEEQTLRELRRRGVPSSGHVGAGDPVAAIEDALRFFDADRIALALHTHGRRRYRERDLRAEIERRFKRPVVAVEAASARAA
jgi:hypothetical protein